MHEMSLAESLIEIIRSQAHSQQFSRVRTVWLEIGELALVEPESLRFCFQAVSRNSPAEGARLEIIDQPARAACQECGCEFGLRQRYQPCPDCGGHRLTLLQGESMTIKQLEVE